MIKASASIARSQGVEKMARPCAWCPRAPNEPPDTSHSVCDEHRDQLLIQSALRQFNKVPSYVEQREKFIQYKEKINREVR